ncbi:MAG: cytochrome c [SAR324 cluster bacterium]|nr:cytochrome c [SAR324 cluster bacterium]
MKRKFLILLGLFALIVTWNLSARTTLFTLVTDMFNQISIKPQEKGSMRTFPIGIVSVDGRVNEDPADRFSWMEKEIRPETATNNPFEALPESLANGKLKFNTYCQVCHGDSKAINKAGFAATKINELGMIAPAVIALTPSFSDGYIYHKAKYGGAVMPALGYATTDRDRWDIINYIRTLEKAP